MSQVAANPWAPSAPETWEAGILGRWSGFQFSRIPAPRGPMLSVAGEVGTVAYL